MSLTYQPNGDYLFSAENIRNCEKTILSIQRRMDKAVADNDKNSIRETFNLLTRKSNAVKVLAVWRITQRNQGKYTAGVDGIAIPKKDRQTQNRIRLKLLEQIDIDKKPDQIRRVYIPKPNGKKRPLGIPTIKDRIVQEILRITIDPIAEYHFSDNSFGFRPKRSCHDAVQCLFGYFNKSNSKRYVIEGDIKGCFDNINHNHITQTLKDWGTPRWATETIGKMLKADIFYNGEVYNSNNGTPQGGVISPLLANVALTALDNFCHKNYGYTHIRKGKKEIRTPIVRYADDFVIVCQSEIEAIKIKSEIATFLYDKIGLTLSEEKTKITHIRKGFDFLGFNFRKYYDKEKAKQSDNKWGNYKLLIKPQKEKVIDFLRNCKDELDKAKSATQAEVINTLNPKLTGWCMYYRHVVSKQTFGKIDHEIWHKLLKWANRRHPNKSKTWVIRKYYSRQDKVKAVFTEKESKMTIFRLAKIPIKRFVKVKNGIRVYDKDPQTQEYWQKREFSNAYNQIYSVKVRRLYNRQVGICPYCKGHITQNQIGNSEVEIHHIKPRSFSGNNDYSNLRILHAECHRELHAKISRIDMANLSDNGINYIENNPNLLSD